jgi:hypothetical protein
MVATAINPTVRYIPPGKRRYYWVTTITTYTSPLRSELDAGKDLTAEIADVTGFDVTSDMVETPDLGTTYTSKVPGRTNSSDSSITFYADSTSNDVRTLLPRNTSGFVVIFGEGDVTGQKMDVFPARVASEYVDQGTADPGRVVVNFSITRLPAQNVTIP